MRSQAEFIARQLNDHQDSHLGVKQGTFHTWSEPHIQEALLVAVGYLFSLRPDLFSAAKELKLPEPSCTIDFPCCKVLEILGIGACLNVSISEDRSSNNLLTMLPVLCTPDKANSWSLVRLNDHLFISPVPIPANTLIRYLCAGMPDDINKVDECIFNEYNTLIVGFALWWLLLTDNESRTNLDRVDRYYQMVKDFVELKLLLEFSLNEDDYKFGRRRVND